MTSASAAGLDPAVPIVIAASACWETMGPLNAHHVARRLAGRGHRVLFVESTGLRSPSIATGGHDRARVVRRLADWRRGPRRVERNVTVLSPLALPWRWPDPARRISMRWLGAATRRGTARLGFDRPVLWSFLPTHIGIADALPHRLLVYHCVDHYAANPGVDRDWIDALETRMLARADVVLATSAVLAERLSARRDDVVRIDNVADTQLFAQAVTDPGPEPAELETIGRPRAVYLGNIAAYRVDLDLLLHAASARPDVEFVLIGAAGLGDDEAMPAPWRSLCDMTNVHVLGPRPHAELPAWLAHCDVGLIPFRDNEHTRASLPLKLWEYVAAGLPVVARDLPNLREAAAEGVVSLAADPTSFAAAIDQAIASSTPEQRRRRLDIARRHDWGARIEELCQVLAAKLP